MTTAAQDVLKIIHRRRASQKHAPDIVDRRHSKMSEDIAAQELKQEYEIRQRIQLGRIKDKIRRRLSRQGVAPSSDLTLTDSVYSPSPGTSRLEGTGSSLTTISHGFSDGTPISSARLETRSPVESKEEKRERIKKRWNIHKRSFPSFASAVEQYRQRLQAERESGLDLLETIRVLRGLNRKEFYDGIEIEEPIKEEDKDTQQNNTVVEKEEEEKHKPKIREKKKSRRKSNVDILDDSSVIPVLPKLFSQKEKRHGEVLETGDGEVLRSLFKSPEQMDQKNLETEQDVDIQKQEVETSLPEVTSSEQEADVSITNENSDSDEASEKDTYPADEITTRKRYSIGCKIDSRWPEGHRHFTKPILESDMVSPHRRKSHMSKNLRESMATILAIYKNDKYIYTETEKTGYALSKRKKSKFNEMFEDWRTELMKVAYDGNSGLVHKCDKRFSYPILPSMHTGTKYPFKKTNSINVMSNYSTQKNTYAPNVTIRKTKRLQNTSVVSDSDNKKDIFSEKSKNQCTRYKQRRHTHQMANKASYLSDYSKFTEKIRERVKTHYGNGYDDDKETNIERISPSTDSAIHEPNSDSENEHDNSSPIHLPPINPTNGLYTVHHSNSKSENIKESRTHHVTNFERKGIGRSRNLNGIQRMLKQEPERNERIIKLFDRLQDSRPNSHHRKNRANKLRKSIAESTKEPKTLDLSENSRSN